MTIYATTPKISLIIITKIQELMVNITDEIILQQLHLAIDDECKNHRFLSRLATLEGYEPLGLQALKDTQQDSDALSDLSARSWGEVKAYAYRKQPYVDRWLHTGALKYLAFLSLIGLLVQIVALAMDDNPEKWRGAKWQIKFF